jgi:hypothetical protein
MMPSNAAKNVSHRAWMQNFSDEARKELRVGERCLSVVK